MFFKTPANLPSPQDADLDLGNRFAAFKKAADDMMCDCHTEKFIVSPNAAYILFHNQLRQWERNQGRQPMITLRNPSPNSVMLDAPGIEHHGGLDDGEFKIVHGRMESPKKPPPQGYRIGDLPVKHQPARRHPKDPTRLQQQLPSTVGQPQWAMDYPPVQQRRTGAEQPKAPSRLHELQPTNGQKSDSMSRQIAQSKAMGSNISSQRRAL
jgi:hypothetical protein